MTRIEEFLRSEIPEIESRYIDEHLSRLEEGYFNKFSNDEIKKHVLIISTLTSNNPFELILKKMRDESIELTILSFDYPSVFSLITGILAGTGFHILSGDVYTYRRFERAESEKGFSRKDRISRRFSDPFERRRIIDCFSGVLSTSMPFKQWEMEIRDRLKTIIGLLEAENEKSSRKAKNIVNEMVVKQLSNVDMEKTPTLFPVEIDIDNESGPFTRLKAISEDTPAFLYALSNTLSLNGILVEHVRIRTIRGRVEDQLDLLDARGQRIENPQSLDRIKFSLLLTKQFTYYLSKAPDPYAALSRFEQLVEDIFQQPAREEWIHYLTDSKNLKDLALLLGASDYLWEDFVRLQYESLLPILRSGSADMRQEILSEGISQRLEKELAGTISLEEKKRIVNHYKDQEAFLIDLNHILDPENDFISLSEQLTRLAEVVVKKAAEIVYEYLTERYGRPRSIAGIEARYSVLGLGKLGGAALGYASDIELLIVYSDNGKTDGKESIHNSEFFDLFVKGIFQFIESKREGIFRVDLRLRPYGNSGPLACSLQSFCQYYGKEGQAHSYERLALVRMRFIGGDSELGKQLERIRDEILYFSKSIDLKHLRDLREKQFKEKNTPGRVNAKFSPGGLVDLEYGVQILQVLNGRNEPRLRTARIHNALNALSDAGVLSSGEAIQLINAYNFLRRLINGLRMLRGSANDLFLPPVETVEFEHLSRRMGYGRGGPIDSAQRLYIDLETHLAIVRIFTEKFFGREALPNPKTGTIVDVILSESMPLDLVNKILSDAGFRDTRRACVNINGLAGKGSRRATFARIALLTLDILKRTPDPDMALNNWDRYTRALANPEFHFNTLMSQPMQLELMLNLFATSQFLADTLVRNPGFFDWLIMPEVLHDVRKRDEIEDELRNAAKSCSDLREWLNKIRRFRRRSILRIGARDIYLGESIRIIMQELTTFAEACTQVVLEKCIEGTWHRIPEGSNSNGLKNKFCIMAFGKMGGNELNYSSDIDLIGVYDGSPDRKDDPQIKHCYKEIFSNIMESVSSDLTMHTEEGYAYRVDLRLRPFGKSGDLVHSIPGLINYYAKSASLWELQAAIKLRPVAGNLRIGYDFLKQLEPLLYVQRDRRKIVASIEKMRNEAIKSSSRTLSQTIDVKSGMGGIRDVEFMVQGLQLIYAPDNKTLSVGNTLLAMEALAEAGIIPRDTAETLREDYIFLRRTEHFLQLLEDRQIHNLPKTEMELEAMAKRVLGPETNSGQFMEKMNDCLKRIREGYIKFFVEGLE